MQRHNNRFRTPIYTKNLTHKPYKPLIALLFDTNLHPMCLYDTQDVPAQNAFCT